MVQVRDPGAKAGALVETARALVAALAPFGVPLIVNDRPDVALAAGAAGVHLGQDDLPVAAARAILGPDAIIGLSITHVDQAADVAWDLVDHVGAGPVFATATKADAAPPLGLAGLAEVCARALKPVVAIGGIDLSRAPSCLHAGAAGVAIVSAIASAPDPEAAARAFAEIAEQGRMS